MFRMLVRVTSSALLFREEAGQTLVEYALILSLVSVAGFVLLEALGGYPSAVFSTINADF
jgi:Flp pilus assembly pilin Flp